MTLFRQKSKAMKVGRKTYKSGIMEGREQRAYEVARALKREGLPEDVIYRVTGLKPELYQGSSSVEPEKNTRKS